MSATGRRGVSLMAWDGAPRLLIAGILAFLALLVALVGATGWSLQRQTAVNGWVEHTFVVRERVANVLSLLADAETGQRGYLLTGRDAYLAPYAAATAGLSGNLAEIARLTADNPRQALHLAALRREVADKLDELEATIVRARARARAAATPLVMTGRGKELMDAARVTIRAMQAEESRLLAERGSAADRVTTLLHWLISAAAISLVALGVLVFLGVRRFMRALVASHALVERRNADLVAEIAARRAAEDQLVQSQKMEAVGQLTGGIAHDFNNMLAVVISAINLLKRRLSRGDTDVDQFADAAIDGAQRAATLTSRLLSFARQQPLEPRILDANRMVGSMSELLRRALGEHIELETVLAGGLWRTRADPAQLESSVLNLAVNARDAMGEAGKLTIETANCHLDDAYAASNLGVPPGQYVLIAVSDTGPGMAPDVLAKVFEPFFTTKPAGKGTGLGLSQVFGFVKQSNGHIKIYSELGAGTVVKIYLPRDLGAEEEGAAPPAPREQQPVDPAVVILVVEDDEQVRLVTVATLRELGYAVLHASRPSEALQKLRDIARIDLMFTDVVMPEMNGARLAEAARALRPDLRVLYTTGYTRNAIVHNGALDAGADLLMKPFSIDQLAAKIAAALRVSA